MSIIDFEEKKKLEKEAAKEAAKEPVFTYPYSGYKPLDEKIIEWNSTDDIFVYSKEVNDDGSVSLKISRR
jgi:hypothetical protein